MRHVTAARAELMEEAARRERNAPHVLLSDALERHRSALEQIFEGLRVHYMPCLLRGDLDLWSKAAKACIDLVVDAPESPTRRDR